MADAIDALLPQTQCRKCGYAGCRPYAEAIASGEAPIDRCPPGGARGIERLAALTGRAPVPLDSSSGAEGPRGAALIDEGACIGCTLCIQACPIDAIAGAPRQMHTVLLEHCSGCELCVAPCPVDCIEMVPLHVLAAQGSRHASLLSQVAVADESVHWRSRFLQRAARLERERSEHELRLAHKAQEKLQALEPRAGDPGIERKRAVVRAAIERARARRACTGDGIRRDGSG
ncbi:MAG: RnfABCDGE type electron transport complex subunit B [Burkholderiales bacterium]|nr:RnfABCDGE type electron transport complex subunit B [Burkholderiales bacterium]